MRTLMIMGIVLGFCFLSLTSPVLDFWGYVELFFNIVMIVVFTSLSVISLAVTIKIWKDGSAGIRNHRNPPDHATRKGIEFSARNGRIVNFRQTRSYIER